MRRATGVIAAYIIATLALSAAGSAYAESIRYSESKVTVKNRETFCQDSRVQAERLVVGDMAGKSIKWLAAGSQALLQATIDNNCSIDDYPVTIIFEVRDFNGMTSYLTIQQIRLSPATQMFTVSSSWTPENPGEYTVRVFSMACPTCLGILSQVMSYDVSVY
ncbi:MAG: hypothetical protein ACREAY_06235 [Nitrososphaera sp.]|uniref:hypothetical protein n=1 Tax=Nitrososphaera sp. TaxID=1971748 RepID=UPI003D6F704B